MFARASIVLHSCWLLLNLRLEVEWYLVLTIGPSDTWILQLATFRKMSKSQQMQKFLTTCKVVLITVCIRPSQTLWGNSSPSIEVVMFVQQNWRKPTLELGTYGVLLWNTNETWKTLAWCLWWVSVVREMARKRWKEENHPVIKVTASDINLMSTYTIYLSKTSTSVVTYHGLEIRLHCNPRASEGFRCINDSNVTSHLLVVSFSTNLEC